MTVAVARSVDVERLPLSMVLECAPPGQEAAPDFTAWLDGEAYQVTAVLERTAVIVRPGEAKRLKRHDLLEVEPGAVRWRRKGAYGRWREPADDEALRTERRSPNGLPADGPGSTVSESPVPDDHVEEKDGRSRCPEEQTPPAAQGESGSMRDQAPTAGDARPPEASPAPPETSTLVRGGPLEASERAGGAESSAIAASPLPETDQGGTEPRPRPLSCGRCGRGLRAHNRHGVCTPCRRTCPICGGSKGVQSESCRRCRGEDASDPASTSPGNRRDDALGSLPGRVQDVVEQYLDLARYAHGLEVEQDRQREELRLLRRRVEAFLASGARLLIGAGGRQ
jgi:hypothetical protein